MILFIGLFFGDQEWALREIPAQFEFYSNSEVPDNIETDLDMLLTSEMSVGEITVIIQEYIKRRSLIIMPNREITVASSGLFLDSNKTLIFQKRSKLRMEGNSLEKNGLLNMINSQNVHVHHAFLIGDRYEHTGNTGEWGMGIYIRGGRNIVINNFYIEKFWGDGIYVGKENDSISKNIVIGNGVLNDNRRDGISITSVDGLQLNNVTAANSNGTNPQFGFAIEPNNHKDIIDHIEIDSIYTFNNLKGGFKTSLNKIGGKDKKNVNITVRFFQDLYSYRGVYINRLTERSKNVVGKISFDKIVVSGNDEPIIIKSFFPSNFKVSIKDFQIENPKNFRMTNAELIRVNKNKSNVEIQSP